MPLTGIHGCRESKQPRGRCESCSIPGPRSEAAISLQSPDIQERGALNPSLVSTLEHKELAHRVALHPLCNCFDPYLGAINETDRALAHKDFMLKRSTLHGLPLSVLTVDVGGATATAESPLKHLSSFRAGCWVQRRRGCLPSPLAPTFFQTPDGKGHRFSSVSGEVNAASTPTWFGVAEGKARSRFSLCCTP